MADADLRAPRDDSFARLRSIIVGPEQREIVALRAHLLDPTVQTRDVSRVLPDALQLRARDPQLMRALAPSIEDAITASVSRDPQPLADALFPVIGPAIRKAVAHTFDSLVESLNQAVERTVSWRALRWRVMAWRTGRPYAEIVLANTLAYRVEQLFLIHRESGLLLQHVAADSGTERDADQVSAMLTAITAFVRDSFRVGRTDTLESLRVGELAVSIVAGPQAILAAVVRGSVPLAVRASFADVLESVHRQFGPALQNYDGDSSAFAAARPALDACLLSQRRDAAPRPSYRGWALAAAAVLAVFAVWMYLDFRAERSWSAYLERLRQEPGIVVLSSTRAGGRFHVAGLRDPLAADPVTLLEPSSPVAAAAIESRWEPYQALHPPFVTRRAASLLRPPDGVSLTFQDGTLTATGTAPAGWVEESERLALAVAGVERFVFAGESAESRIASQIEALSIGFAKAESALDPRQQAALDSVTTRLRELDGLLASSGRQATVGVLGQADSDGPEDLNNRLSQARADRVVAVLRGAALERIELVARGLGRAPATPGATEAEHERNRRVSFEVQVTDGDRPRVR
jgi:OOP family OmpA-OmpF porin